MMQDFFFTASICVPLQCQFNFNFMIQFRTVFGSQYPKNVMNSIGAAICRFAVGSKEQRFIVHDNSILDIVPAMIHL